MTNKKEVKEFTKTDYINGRYPTTELLAKGDQVFVYEGDIRKYLCTVWLATERELELVETELNRNVPYECTCLLYTTRHRPHT